MFTELLKCLVLEKPPMLKGTWIEKFQLSKRGPGDAVTAYPERRDIYDVYV